MGECRISKKRKFNTFEVFEKHFKKEHEIESKVHKDVLRQEAIVSHMEAELPRQKRLLSEMKAHLERLKEHAPPPRMDIKGN
jgi:hypothetical protein